MNAVFSRPSGLKSPLIIGTYWNFPYHYISLKVEGIQTVKIGFGLSRNRRRRVADITRVNDY